MRALVLAAGRGSRMHALTDDRPKCFVALRGRTLLERQLTALREGGAGEIAIVTGYRAESFEPLGLPTFHNARWSATNMVASLQAARSWLRDAETLVSYSDIFYDAETVRRLAAADADLAIAYDPDWFALWSRRFEDPFDDAESFRIDPAGRVLEIGRKRPERAEVQGQYMGLLKVRPAAWERVAHALARMDERDVDRLEMTSLLAHLLDRGAEVAGVPVAGAWGEVDSESDLRLYETMIDSSPAAAEPGRA